MEISVHLRGGDNRTNMRSQAIAKGLEAAGHTLTYRGRGEAAQGDDLVIQTGFARSTALLSAIEQETPYIIMEEPTFRPFLDGTNFSSFTYNGLAGGGYRPAPKHGERAHPPLGEGRGEGTLIIGQKPTDHSLRGADHVKWIKDKLDALPDATFRHHPLMVMPGTQEALDTALARHERVVAWNSTTCVNAHLAGCLVTVEGPGAEYREGESPEELAHRLSWANFSHAEYATPEVAQYVLSGYERAEADAATGDQEIPREKVDGTAICRRYYFTFPEAR